MYPFETEDLPQDEEEDIDPFEELEIGTKSVGTSQNDILSAFEDEDDPLSLLSEEIDISEETVISFESDDAPDINSSNLEKSTPTESTYKLLLETVWVDDILDPSEVELLARKRKELGLSFERHLQLVREVIGCLLYTSPSPRD